MEGRIKGGNELSLKSAEQYSGSHGGFQKSHVMGLGGHWPRLSPNRVQLEQQLGQPLSPVCWVGVPSCSPPTPYPFN